MLTKFFSRQPEVIELHLQLTPAMLELQTALLDLISYVVKEIKRLNPVVSVSMMNRFWK